MKLDKLFSEYPYLEGHTVKLMKIIDEDLDHLFKIYDNDNVFQYCGIIPKHNKKIVGNMISHFERDFNKRSIVKLGIFIQGEKRTLSGIIEIMNFNKRVNAVTIGYFLAEEYWGKGIATEAVTLLRNFLFNEIEINRIQAEVMLNNTSSKRVLLKNDFVKEGIHRQAAYWPGKGIIDYEVYGILKTEYELNLKL